MKKTMLFTLLLIPAVLMAQKSQPNMIYFYGAGSIVVQDSLTALVHAKDSSSTAGVPRMYVTPTMLNNTVWGTFHSGGLVTLSGTTGITLTGTAVTKGINFASLTPAFNADNAYVAIGTWNAPITISSQTAHFVPIQVNLSSNTSVAADIAAARFRVNTAAANTLTAVNVLELRSSTGYNVGSHANLQASSNISDDMASTGDFLVGYFSLQGTAGKTITCSNHVNVLEATNTFAGTGVKNVSHFTNNGGTVADILKLESLNSAVATNGFEIANTSGTIGSALRLTGTYTTDIVLQHGETISNAVDGTINFGTCSLVNTGTVNGFTLANGSAVDTLELAARLLKNADSTTLRNQFLKNADSTTIRNYDNALYKLKNDSSNATTGFTTLFQNAKKANMWGGTAIDSAYVKPANDSLVIIIGGMRFAVARKQAY